MRSSPISVESLESRRLFSNGIAIGTVFNDLNANGFINSNDVGIGGVKIFVDLKKTGVYATGDPFVTTMSNGNYGFALKPGTYNINAQPPTGFQQTYPLGGKDDVVVIGSNKLTIAHDFGETSSVHVAGKVSVNTNGKISLLAGAKVTVVATTGGTSYVRTTDMNGAWGVSGLPKNKAYKATLTLPGGYVAASSLTMTSPVLASGKSDFNLNFTLKPIVVLGTSKRFVQLTSGFDVPPNALPTVTKTAVANNAFNGSVSGNTSKTFQLEQGPDTITVGGFATQVSSLSATEIKDAGQVNGSQDDTAGGGTSFAQGESFFSETFTVNASTHYSITADASNDGPYSPSGALSLKGPGGASVFATQTITFNNGGFDLAQSGTLAAGTYTLTFDVKAYDNNANDTNAVYTMDLKI